MKQTAALMLGILGYRLFSEQASSDLEKKSTCETIL
jgi:hypothetical protein